MKNVIRIILLILMALLIFFFIKNANGEERPFNEVQLSYSNDINNLLFPVYYDTILNVAMDEAGLSGYVVVLEKLNDAARSQFDGQLKAHVRYYNGGFYLFTENMSRKEAIEVLSHEVVHMQQYVSGDLQYQNNMVIWKGKSIDLESQQYEVREWENDAFARQGDLINSVDKKLWPND